MNRNPTGHERILVALDVSTRSEALSATSGLQGLVGGFKVGLQLFAGEGPLLVRDLIASGQSIFVDLKLHDIPNTVEFAARELAKLRVGMMTVHTSGGTAMLEAAVRGARDGALLCDIDPPLVVGITVLTSLDEADVREVTGSSLSVRDHVRRYAAQAKKAGLDGVVASPHEIETVRSECGSDFLIVTPGVRPLGSSSGDQKRVMTPSEAARLGSNYLVIGRPILAATDPTSAARAVAAELNGLGDARA